MKEPNYAPVYTAAMYPLLAGIARSHGYALAVHGTLARDMDLIAVPWTDDAGDPLALIASIVEETSARFVDPPTDKPHGRVTYALSVGFGECMVDLSIMPRAPSAREGEATR